MNSLLDRRLVTLMAVAETGSMTAAANRLYVTQPAVSQQLASLGKDLGLPLLTHRGTRVELTPVARELVAYARRLTLDNRAVLAHLQTGQTPPLRLGVTVSLGNFLLPRLLADPTIAARALEVTIANTATLAAQLRAGKLTAALVEGNFPAADFASLDLGLADFIGVAAQPLPALTLPELFSHYLLVREPGSGTREILTNWLAAHNAGLADIFGKNHKILSLNGKDAGSLSESGMKKILDDAETIDISFLAGGKQIAHSFRRLTGGEMQMLFIAMRTNYDPRGFFEDN